MDDNIYRDFYWAADILTTDSAFRVYALLAIALTLLASTLIAFRIKRELEEIAGDVFVVTRQGRPPTKPKSIEKALEKLRAERARIWRKYFSYLLIFLICGFAVPTLALFLGVTFYDWFDPVGKPLLYNATQQIVATPTYGQIWYFVVNQLSHGALTDYPEVFRQEWSDVTNNPANVFFSSAVVIYRFMVGAFALVFPLFLLRATRVAWSIPSVRTLNKHSA
ncbi:MAG: hypothetical protein ACOH12_16560 [Parvibaculaceae bacterium]